MPLLVFCNCSLQDLGLVNRRTVTLADNRTYPAMTKLDVQRVPTGSQNSPCNSLLQHSQVLFGDLSKDLP